MKLFNQDSVDCEINHISHKIIELFESSIGIVSVYVCNFEEGATYGAAKEALKQLKQAKMIGQFEIVEKVWQSNIVVRELTQYDYEIDPDNVLMDNGLIEDTRPDGYDSRDGDPYFVAECQSLRILYCYLANYLEIFLIKLMVNFFGDCRFRLVCNR